LLCLATRFDLSERRHGVPGELAIREMHSGAHRRRGGDPLLELPDARPRELAVESERTITRLLREAVDARFGIRRTEQATRRGEHHVLLVVGGAALVDIRAPCSVEIGACIAIGRRALLLTVSAWTALSPSINIARTSAADELERDRPERVMDGLAPGSQACPDAA
jgi:hypothetical protein